MDENGMKFNDTQIDDLTKAMFEDADPGHRGGVCKFYFMCLFKRPKPYGKGHRKNSL